MKTIMSLPRVYGTLRDICGVVQSIAHHYEPNNIAHVRAALRVQHILLHTLASLQSIYSNSMLLPACRSIASNEQKAIAKVVTCYVLASGSKKE